MLLAHSDPTASLSAARVGSCTTLFMERRYYGVPCDLDQGTNSKAIASTREACCCTAIVAGTRESLLLECFMRPFLPLVSSRHRQLCVNTRSQSHPDAPMAENRVRAVG
jgi:hypothetical protein